MKITRSKLVELLGEASSFQMARFDKDSQDIMTATGIFLQGIQVLIGEELDEEDEYEYGQDIRSIFERNIEVTRNLAALFLEIRAGRREPSEPEHDVESQLQDVMSGEELEAVGVDYDEEEN